MSTQRDDPIVWTVSESEVFHVAALCKALTRSNGRRPASPKLLSVATGPKAYSGRRRPCKLCVPGSDVEALLLKQTLPEVER